MSEILVPFVTSNKVKPVLVQYYLNKVGDIQYPGVEMAKWKKSICVFISNNFSILKRKRCHFMVQMMTIHQDEIWNNLRSPYLSNQIHLQTHPQDKHSTDNKRKMTRLILHNTVRSESARLPASCMGGRAESRSRGGAGLVWRGWQKRTARSHGAPRDATLWATRWFSGSSIGSH